MQYWVLKAKPADYNYANKLRPNGEDDWESVPTSAGLKAGDRVFLWASSPARRLAGLGVVTRAVGENFLRVRYLTGQFTQMIGIASLKTIPALERAPFLNAGHYGTAFGLTAAQALVLYRIITKQNPGTHPWTDWTKAPEIDDGEAEVSSINISEQLARRLPILRQEHGDQIGRLEKARRAFVKDYSAQKLTHLPIEKYASGLGKGTFCYCMEWELDGLGRIRGSYATKFGVFFSKKEKSYVFTRIWGTSAQGAYTRLREAIIQLLRDAAENDIDALNTSRISPMFKGKILHLYFPEKFAPIYSPEHLKHFISCLNLSGNHETSIERQQALMDFRKTEPLLRNEPVGLMMRFLYSEFPPNEKDGEPKQEDGDRSPETPLSDAIAGLELLDSLPNTEGLGSQPKAPKPGKFDAGNGRRKHIGDRGEAIVFESEKKRLRKANRPDLAKKVKHVAATDDTKGYDILSFDEDGTPRQIEVKATTGKNLGRGFYLTANELRASEVKDANYYIYFVFETLSAKPRLYIYPNPKLGPTGFVLRPTQYHVTVTSS